MRVHWCNHSAIATAAAWDMFVWQTQAVTISKHFLHNHHFYVTLRQLSGIWYIQESLANAKVSMRQPWYIGRNSLIRRPHSLSSLWNYGEVKYQETRVMELLCGEGCMILTSTVFDWSMPVWRTDGRAMAYSALQHKLCCRALKIGRDAYVSSRIVIGRQLNRTV